MGAAEFRKADLLAALGAEDPLGRLRTVCPARMSCWLWCRN